MIGKRAQKPTRSLKPRLVVWSFGMLLGAAIASYLAAQLWVTNETVRILGDDPRTTSWETGMAAVSSKAHLWKTGSLWAIGVTLLLYAGSFGWYLTRGKK